MATIRSIGKKGDVQIIFNKNIAVVANYSAIDNTVLEIKVNPGRDSNASDT